MNSSKSEKKSLNTKTSNKSTREGTPILGTQSINRAISILREISMHGEKGLRLVEIANTFKLEIPTSHRILKGLLSQGMLMQDAETKHYRLGHLVYELGLSASISFNLKETCQPSMNRLAKLTEDAIYLVVRSGFDSVCIDFMEGSYPIQARTLTIGGRRPLGVGAGGLALLLEMSDGEIEHILATNEDRMKCYGGLSISTINKAILKSRELGYSINEKDVMPEVGAIGLAIKPKIGKAYAAISIAGVVSRFSGARQLELSKLLMAEVSVLEKKIEAQKYTWG